MNRLDLAAGARVKLTLDKGRLVMEPQGRPRYTMTELLAASDYSEPQPPDQREWVDTPEVGKEALT